MTENERENIVEKIRKMLRLARDKGASEAEAASAMAMAQRLMMRYNIDNVEEKVEQIAIRGDWKNYEVDKKWQQMLLSAVAKLYNCRSIFTRSGAVQFVGKPASVLVCADTLQWVTDQVNDLHKQALKAFRGDGRLTKFQYRDFRLTFKEACALRIWHRVNEIVAASRNEIPAHMALVVIDQALAAADDLMNEANIKKTGKAMKLRRSGFGTGAGYTAGNQIKLQHNVQPAKPTALLGGAK